jgi:hypothetical protein
MRYPQPGIQAPFVPTAFFFCEKRLLKLGARLLYNRSPYEPLRADNVRERQAYWLIADS